MTFVPIRSLVLVASLLFVPSATDAADAAAPAPTLQPPVGAKLNGPRRIAATSSGKFVVVDARGNVQLLTQRGDFMATLLRGAQTVAAGGGKVFVTTAARDLVTIDESSGRVQGRAALGLAAGPTGMAFDSARGVIWMVYDSGMVETRRPDGSLASRIARSVAGNLSRLVDVAVDADAGLVWVASDREDSAGMLFGLDAVTGARRKVVGVGGNGPAKVTGALQTGAGGRLYVSDLLLNKVEVVDAGGVRLQTIGASDAGAGMLSQPTGLAFMRNGDLLVANVFAGRLDRYGDGSPLPTCAGDADCDGMADAWEVAHGLAANDPTDAFADADADGLTTTDELALGTNPNAADTDGDGVADPVDQDPLNAADRVPSVVAAAGEYAPGRVTLSASVSNVGDAGDCTVAWTQTGGPTVALSGADGLAPSFVARKAGDYRFSVTASCGGASSDAMPVIAKVLNLAPIADAPRVAVVELGQRLTIGAQRSSDANADAIAYGWEQLSGPAVLAASDDAVIAPRFSAPGAYRFKVTATDRAGAASAAEVDVVALGAQPVATASVVSPVQGAVGQPMALDSSGSYRAEGAAFAWRQVAGPQVALAGADAAVASFVAAVPGRYAFAVEVSQGGVASPPAIVEAFVGSSLPVAVALAPAVAPVNTAVVLNGSASGSASGDLQYAWRQVSGPAAGLGSTSAALASAYLFVPGSYEFELSVTDGSGVGVPARVRVEARRDGKAIPTANVATPAAARVGDRVALDGSKSVGAKKFRWTQLAGPWVLLGGDPVETFNPEQAGTYVFELEVDDGQVRSAPARVSVVVVGDGMEN